MSDDLKNNRDTHSSDALPAVAALPDDLAAIVAMFREIVRCGHPWEVRVQPKPLLTLCDAVERLQEELSHLQRAFDEVVAMNAGHLHVEAERDEARQACREALKLCDDCLGCGKRWNQPCTKCGPIRAANPWLGGEGVRI